MDIEKEFGDLIKNTLVDNEEDYIAGSWENYVLKQKRRRMQIYRRYGIGIAAGIAICLICLNLFRLSEPDNSSTKKEAISYTNKSVSGTTKSISGMTKVQNSDQKISIIETVPKRSIAVLKEKSATSSGNIINSYIPVIEEPVNNLIADSAGTGQNKKIKESYTINNQNKIKESFTVNNQYNTSDPYKSKDDAGRKIHGSERKVRFGINIAPGLNSTSTASSYNYSGGVNIDIALSKNIQLSTGMQLEHQNVVSRNAGLNTAIPSDHTSADLVNLDFPLNITWKFLSLGLNRFYVSGGISSLAYLSEKYITTSYKQELRETATMLGEQEPKTYKLENIESTTLHNESAFHAIDFAGRINLVLGMEHQLTPKLSLHLEPYLKIPVSHLASENLKYTTSGITCKISF